MLTLKPANQPQMVDLNFASNVLLSPEMLLERIKVIDTMTDEEIYKLVKDYYETILTDIFTNKENGKRSEFTYLFMVPKFIIALTQVMYTMIPDDITRRRLNKMSYDYLVLKEHNRDSYVSGLLTALSKTVNRDKIPKLCLLSISEDLASLLALARYSSEKETVNVKRLNRVLMNQPASSLSEQKVVDIYLALFNHILPLFTGVMLDVVSAQNLSPDTAEVYGLITLATLDLINELPIVDIKKGLTMFDEDRRIQYQDYPLRINLESCSPEDYPRLLKAIDSLKNEGIYIATH